MSTPTGQPGDENPYGQPNPYGQQPNPYEQQPPYGQQPAYGQQPWAGQPGYQAPYGGGTQRNSLAVWSLVLGIVGLCCGIAGIGALVLGKQAKDAVARGEANNGGMATAGIVLGWVAIAFWILGIILRVTGVVSYDFSTSS